MRMSPQIQKALNTIFPPERDRGLKLFFVGIALYGVSAWFLPAGINRVCIVFLLVSVAGFVGYFRSIGTVGKSANQ